ncbi:MAG TPA: FAD-dependent oxidoreductase [Thermoanaerobaculia bacterium]|nr:FAD-dependent oxidoreductase [Thermoanaerobaculia bacterium]
MQTADVVIVGAGVIGASIAWHLASRGCRKVILLDRGHDLNSGSTARATGGYRAQFATEVNIRLSLLSREKLKRFQEEVGTDSGYSPSGYLFLASSENELAVLRAANALQRRLGVTEAVVVDAAEALAINPAVTSRDVIGGTFCASDGFIRPLQILRGYLDDASRLGAKVIRGAKVTGLAIDSGRIGSVQTTSGDVSPGIVVNAGGAWAGSVAALAGIEIPVVPLKRQVAVTVAGHPLPETMPMTIFTRDGFHLRVRDGRVLLLWPDVPRSEDPFDTSVEDPWIERVAAFARDRIGCLRDVAIDRSQSWAGLYEMSPDKHVIIGRTAIANLLLANGSSGHGVMHSPAIGQLVAEMILDGRAHSIDIHALRPSRFADGEPNQTSDVL